jgi:hypothetical protein
MALKPKSGSVRIRIDPELLEAFRVICARRGMTVSDGLRRFMEDRVGTAYQSARESQVAAENVRAITPLALVEKPPVEAPIEPEGYVLPRQSRSERRKAERDAKKNRC